MHNGITPERRSQKPVEARQAPAVVLDPSEPSEAQDSPPTAESGAVAEPVPQPPAGTCEDWMAAAGVPLTYAARQLIANESGCRPDAVNPWSGACGIAQSLPCEKMPCTLQDPVCQLRWMDGYIRERYGSWEAALGFWYCIGTCWSNYGSVYKSENWY